MPLLIWLTALFLLTIPVVKGQPPASRFQRVSTYLNPVLPGDHPDPTLLMVGKDFYHCGSSFHFTPYLPIYHSTDLVHWEEIGRVLSPSAAGFVTDRPSAGIWQGAITRFYGSYWIYFSANGQWFCKADSPKGPWSAPVQLRTNPSTGPLGYDNSIFVDDDGKPYMLIKNGQRVNRIQALGRDGQLADTVINLDWINSNLQYSWAEGPVMCKRNGFYFYFPAGDVSGGQFVLRTPVLTSDSSKWVRLGNFFKPVTDSAVRLSRPNHISAPVQLSDGTWWTLGQSYERGPGDDWSGMGRQTSLFQVTWEGDRPWGTAPTTQPLAMPDLPRSGIPWRTVRSDYFDRDSLNACWHFLNRAAAANYSLHQRKGWLRLIPREQRTHIIQKETDHYYSLATKVELDASDTTTRAGIYLTNGNEKVNVRLYSGYNRGKKIIFQFDTAMHSISNQAGNTVWLRLERREHVLTAWYSADGQHWLAVGSPINVANLDKVQPDYNSWVGTSLGLFAEGRPADFDFMIYKGCDAPLMAAGYRNAYHIAKVERGPDEWVTNTSSEGGWFMLPGVDFGKGERPAAQVKVEAASSLGGNLEIWIDDLQTGTLIATVPVNNTGGASQAGEFKKAISALSGQHDVFVRYPPLEHAIFVRSICFATE